MFREALLASGLSPLQANVLYAAVYGGGPRWAAVAGAEAGQPQYLTITPALSADDFREMERWIVGNDPTLEELEREMDRILER